MGKGKHKWNRKREERKAKKQVDTGFSRPSDTHTGSYTSGGTGNGAFGFWNACRHYGAVVKITEGVQVYASSMKPDRDPKEDFVPDYGLYADWGWRVSGWRQEHIDWPDYDRPTNLAVAFAAIDDALVRAERGENVEVGCIGGHGRTGTILAAMMVMSGKSADDAIRQVQSEYCHQAVECRSQEWFVQWVEAVILGVEPPPEPPQGLWSAAKKVEHKAKHKAEHLATTVGHTMADHFYDWILMEVDCGDRDCKTWDGHTVQFRKQLESGKNFSKRVDAGLTWDEHIERAVKGEPHPNATKGA